MRFKRYITGIFICVLAIILMSHNVGAVSPVFDARLVRTKANTTLGWNGSDCDQPQNYIIRVASGKTACSITAFSFGAGYNEFLAGDIVELDIYVIHNANDNALNNWIFATTPQIAESPSTGVSIIGQELSTAGQNIAKITYYLQIGGYVRTTYETRIALNYQWANMVLYSGDYLWANVSTWRVKTDDYSSITGSLEDVVEAIQDSAESSQVYQQQEQQAIEDATEQAQDTADTAQSDSAQATSSLLSTITGFFGAIMSVNATNCKFNSGLPFLEGQGEIDLCAVPAPPIVQTISSLIMIVIFIPFAIHMYNRFISITESFQK